MLKYENFTIIMKSMFLLFKDNLNNLISCIIEYNYMIIKELNYKEIPSLEFCILIYIFNLFMKFK